MREFARRNAGVAAAVTVYGALAAGGVLAVQQMSSGQGAPPIAGPSSPPSSPTPTLTPTQPVRTPSPGKTSTAPDVGQTVVAAGPAQRTSHSSNSGEGGAGGSPTGAPTSRPRPTATAKPPPSTTPTGCQAGRVVAVQLPLGALPCDAVRVGRAVTIGGTKK